MSDVKEQHILSRSWSFFKWNRTFIEFSKLNKSGTQLQRELESMVRHWTAKQEVAFSNVSMFLSLL